MRTFRSILSLYIALFIFSGCNLNNSGSDSDNIEHLFQELNGTWQPVNSISDHPIDANLDGQSSINMLNEITNSHNGFLSIQILEDRINESDYPHLFDLSYLVQAFPPETNPDDPDFYINYITNGFLRGFKFSQSQDSLLLRQDSKLDMGKLRAPKSIKIKNEGLIIEVVVQRRLYTATGWQTITITTRYSRISKET